MMIKNIGVSDLHMYFRAKFCDSEYTNDVILEIERCNHEKYCNHQNDGLNNNVMSATMVKRDTCNGKNLNSFTHFIEYH